MDLFPTFFLLFFFKSKDLPPYLFEETPIKIMKTNDFLNSNSFQLEEEGKQEKIFSKHERRRAGHGQVIIFN
jgi:hypothetical protein